MHNNTHKNNHLHKKQAYIYVRVSSEEQVANFSLDNQIDYCMKEAQRQNLEVLNVYREEGVSAKTLKRPQLIKLLEDCRANKNTISSVLIYKIDRMSRDTFDYLAIKRRLSEYGIRIISVTEMTEENPQGEFMETLFAASAKLDNATKSQRTLDGMRKRVEAGLANGKAPVGYLNVTKNEKCIIEPDPEQFESVKKVWEEMSSGVYSLNTIIPIFNKYGIVIKRGAQRIPITRVQQTQRIFRDKFYCGYVVSKKFNINKLGVHIPLISEQLFYRVQAILDGRSFTAGIHYVKQREDFPLRGVLCDKCGLKMTGSISRGRQDRYSYYFCGHSKHYSPSIPKNVFEREFMAFMHKIEPKREFVLLFSEMIKEKWLKTFENVAQKQSLVDKEINDLIIMRSELVRKNLKGLYSDELFKEQVDLIEKEIAIKKALRYSSDLAKINIDEVSEFMNRFLWNISSAWEKGNLQQRKMIVGSIFPKNIYYCYPSFRTTELGPCFKQLEAFKGVPLSSWVTDGS